MKNKIITIILIIVIGLIIFGADRILKMQEDTNIEENINIGNNNVGGDVHGAPQDENSTILEITSVNFNEEVINSDKKVLIDFYAVWCGPCKILSPIVEEFAKENMDIKVVKIDVDKEPEIAGKYGIISIPTLVVVENGEVVNRAVGIINKENIEKLVGVDAHIDP